MLPKFTAETSLYSSRSHYPASAGRGIAASHRYGSGVVPAAMNTGGGGGDGSVFCGACSLQGCDCQVTCRDCGPWGWFTCCDKKCVNCDPSKSIFAGWPSARL
jgi:hypothetical protein